MRQLFERLERAAASEATVLLEGETGTGKEVTAVSIHESSPRTAGPFVVVDCGAIPGQLLESELFGYERGAFTGAVNARKGAFEAANGGTIFLDEIGELGLDLQPKILRALEGRHVKRVGSNTYSPIDVRVIAATNRNLRSEVAAGRFRSDLYYRLAVLQVRLPPLRERLDDLAALVEDALRQLKLRDEPSAGAVLSPSFIEALARYSWPGNVRQLRNYVERRVALGESVPLPDCDSSMLPPPALVSAPTIPPLIPARLDSMVPSGTHSMIPAKPENLGFEFQIAVDKPLRVARELWNNLFEVRYLSALLDRHDNNITSAARAAGVNRVHFYRLLWKHGLRDQDNSLPEGK